MHNKAKFLKLVSGHDSKWLEDVEWRIENRAWLKKSQAIAIKILRTLRANKASNTTPATQVQLAEQMGVKPQQVNKWVKGKENFTLETISKLEKALGISLVEVPIPNARKEKALQELKQQIDIILKERYRQVQKTSSYSFAAQKTKTKVVITDNEDKWVEPTKHAA